MNRPVHFRLHPLNILKFIRKLLFLLLLPVLRSALNYGLSDTLSTLVTLESALAAILLAYGVLRWARSRVTVDDKMLLIRSGLFFRRTAQVPLSSITCIYVERGPLLTLFGAVKVAVDTNSGEFKRTDFEFYFGRKQVGQLCEMLNAVTPRNRIYLCNLRQIVLMSLSSASALSGLLVAAGIIKTGGRLLGDTLENRLVETLDAVTQTLSRIIPPAATTLASLLVVGFCISFLITLIKHVSFVVRCNKKGVLIEQGLIRHKQSFIRRDAIGAGVISMPPLLHLFHRSSLCIFASGYGTQNGERSILFPVERASEAEKSMHILGVDLCKGDRLTLKVPRRAMSRALFTPCVWLAVIAAVTVGGSLLIPSVRQLVLIFGIFVGAVNAYWLYLRISHTKRGGAELGCGVRVFGFRGLTLTDSRFKRGSVDSITVTEGPFDRRKGLCTLRVTLRGEKAYCARTTNLDKIEVDSEVFHQFNV